MYSFFRCGSLKIGYIQPIKAMRLSKKHMEQVVSSSNKVVRNEKGQVISGTPNPNGRPKGTGISITTAIKRELERIPKGEKASYLDLLVSKIMNKAVIEGDSVTIKQVWNYVDGMPRQSIDHTTDGKELFTSEAAILALKEYDKERSSSGKPSKG